MKFRRFLSIFQIVLFNACVCALWWVVIMEKPERSKALIVVLPLQLAANFAVLGIIRKLRISGLTVIYVSGLLFGLFNMATTPQWWMLIFIPFSVGLIMWSVRVHRAALSKRDSE
jgi:hypothetical protein